MALKDAGIQRVHHNVETAESHYPEVSTTVRYEGRLRTIDAVREAGLETCVGGILNLGESREQRVEMAFELAALEPTSVPINLLNPRPGTKFGDREMMDPLEVVKWVAIFRLVIPDALFRLCGGRNENLETEELQQLAVRGGPERRDDGQLPHHARLRARVGPRDVRGPGAERGPPARQRREPAARTTAPGGSRARARRPLSTSWWTARPRPTSGTPPRSSGTARSARCRRGPTARPTAAGTRASSPPRSCPRSCRWTRGRRRERHRGPARRHPRQRPLPAHARGVRSPGPERAAWTGARCSSSARTTTSGWPITRACARRPPRRRCATAPGAGASRLVSGQHDDPPPARGAARGLQAGRGLPAVRLRLPRQRRRRVRARARGRRRVLRRAEPRQHRRRLPARPRRDVRLRPLRPRPPRVGPAPGRRAAAR